MSVALQDATDTLGTLSGRTDLLPWDPDDREAERYLRALLEAGYSAVKTARGRQQLSGDEKLKLLHSIAVVEHALGDGDADEE